MPRGLFFFNQKSVCKTNALFSHGLKKIEKIEHFFLILICWTSQLFSSHPPSLRRSPFLVLFGGSDGHRGFQEAAQPQGWSHTTATTLAASSYGANAAPRDLSLHVMDCLISHKFPFHPSPSLPLSLSLKKLSPLPNDRQLLVLTPPR